VNSPITLAATQWQIELANCFKRVRELLEYLELPPDRLPEAFPAHEGFAFKVTHSFARRMRKGDPNDPLLRQVLPTTQELQYTLGFSPDPVGDTQSMAIPGLLHKYHGRVLLVMTGACAIHCRYCFRREFPYGQQQLSGQREAAVLQYILSDPTIKEVILSGGDPLLLHDDKLGDLIDALSEISHIKRIRLHSRLPVVLPSRITDACAQRMGSARPQCVLVIHANHTNELNHEVGAALARLRQAGITLLNQTVLLKGINDSATTLCQLSESLFEHGVLPYYLHMLDKVTGASHFDIEEKHAISAHAEMQRRLPGYLVPKLVREITGAPHKSTVGETGS